MFEEFREQLDFKATRGLKELNLGNSSVEDVRQHVDKTVFRSEDGKVRGFKFGFSESGGIISTKQGDEFWMDENGQDIFLKVQVNAETHEALPIETEEIILSDGTKIEYTKKPIHELIGGLVQVGQPLIDASMVGTDSTPEETLRTITFVQTKESTSISGQGVVESSSKSEFKLHNPFKNTEDTKVNEVVPSELTLMREVDLASRKREATTVQSIPAEDIKNHNLRYVTRVSK